jgi:signal peptidase I
MIKPLHSPTLRPGAIAMSLLRPSYILTLLVLVAFSAWFFTLRPSLLGGSASYITVSGKSMLPTYKNGDLVIMKKQPSYADGDIVAYAIPADELGAGSLIIHRVVGRDERGYITRGDNRGHNDLWRPQGSDVLGKAWIHLPGSGTLLSRLKAPLPLAALAGALTVWVLLDSGRKKTPSDKVED